MRWLALLLAVMLFGNGISYLAELSLRVYAEGSANIMGDGGNRAYMEYSINTYAEIERKQIIYAYVTAGETVYVGSDITESQLDINHNNTGAVTGVDIVVVNPSENSEPYDTVKDETAGYIANFTMEQAGPNTEKNGQTEGYTPHSFTATETGFL
ncbi:MAG: hypothetical protein PUB00_06600 [Clostridiales bacterium]|nr:hypothetical protein [Clostridiales bacterium]